MLGAAEHLPRDDLLAHLALVEEAGAEGAGQEAGRERRLTSSLSSRRTILAMAVSVISPRSFQSSTSLQSGREAKTTL